MADRRAAMRGTTLPFAPSRVKAGLASPTARLPHSESRRPHDLPIAVADLNRQQTLAAAESREWEVEAKIGRTAARERTRVESPVVHHGLVQSVEDRDMIWCGGSGCAAAAATATRRGG